MDNNTYTALMFGWTSMLYVGWAMYWFGRNHNHKIAKSILLQGMVFGISSVVWLLGWGAEYDYLVSATFWVCSWFIGTIVMLLIILRGMDKIPEKYYGKHFIPIIIPSAFPFIMMIIWKMNV